MMHSEWDSEYVTEQGVRGWAMALVGQIERAMIERVGNTAMTKAMQEAEINMVYQQLEIMRHDIMGTGDPFALNIYQQTITAYQIMCGVRPAFDDLMDHRAREWRRSNPNAYTAWTRFLVKYGYASEQEVNDAAGR